MVPPSRPPNFFERYYICRDTKGYVTRGFNILVALPHRVGRAQLAAALTTIIDANPWLALNAFRATGASAADDRRHDGRNYVVRRTARFSYADVVSHCEVEAFDAAVLAARAQIRIPVDVELPTWRVAVYHVTNGAPRTYVMLACNHVLFDGRSVANVAADLVAALGAAAAGAADDGERDYVLFDPDSAAPAPVPLAADAVVPLYASSAWFQLKTVAATVRLPGWAQRLVARAASPAPPPPFRAVPLSVPNESQFHLVSLCARELAGVLATCRTLGSTLTPYLAACAYCAAAAALAGARDCLHDSQLVMCGRRYFPEQAAATRYGLYVSCCDLQIEPGLSLTAACAAFRTHLAHAMASRTSFARTGLLDKIRIWPFVEAAVAEAPRTTVEISNLGKFGASGVSDVVFSQGVASSHVCLSVISSDAGGLRITVSCADGLAGGAAFARELRRLLVSPAVVT